MKGRAIAESPEASLFQGDVVVRIEIVDANNFVSSRQQPVCSVIADESGGACEQDLHSLTFSR
jgi:hypothetical protein